MEQRKVHKWWNHTEYVDIETGEMILKNKIDNGEYRILKNTKRYEFTEKGGITTGICYRTNECKRHEQIKIQF